MDRDTLKGKWLPLPLVVVATLAALTVGGALLHAQSCGGAGSRGRSASGSTCSGDRYGSQTPEASRGSAGSMADVCPLEPASLEKLARDLNLDSRQQDTVARIERSYVDRASPIEARIDGDQQELVRVLDSDRVDEQRARRLVDGIGQGYTDLQQARLDAYLQVQGTLEPDQVRRLPLCPYLTTNTWGDAPAASVYDPGREGAAPEPPAAPAHQHQH